MIRKILFVHYGDEWIRGSERCVLDLMSHLDKQNFIPILWCNSDKLVKAASDLEILTVQDDFNTINQSRSIWQPLVEVTKLINKALALIDAYEIDLIHANSVAPCRWMTIAARLRNIPIVGHYHTRYQTRERFLSLSHWVNEIVGVSQDVIKPYIEDNCNQNKSRVIYNGIDYQAYQQDKPLDLSEMFGITASDFSLLSVGSLIDRKGYQDLIASINLLVANGKSVKCVIVGGGPEQQNLQQQISQCGLHNHIFLTGQRYDVGRFYKSSFNAFISTSREEAFGLVNVEAAFCDKPVLAPDVDGLNEIFTHGHTAELFASNKAEVIADSIERLMQCPSYLKLLQINASLLVHKKFTVQRYVSQFESLYREMLSRDPQNRTGLMGFAYALCRGWWVSHQRRVDAIATNQQGELS